MTHADYERWSELSDFDALGEPLSELDRDFLSQFAAVDPTARAEQELWNSLAALEPLADELGNRALAKAAVKRASGDRSATRRRSATLWVGAGALAAAAAVTMVVRTQPPGSTMAKAESVIELGGVNARSAGVVLAQGVHLAAGSEVQAVGGTVCVAVEPTIHVCLADGAKIRLSQIGVPERRVDLLEGRVAAALFPLPHDKGERFSVVSAGVWSTAVGTAFSVELLANGSVETIVHEGKVAVGPDHSAEIVTAHKIGLAESGNVTITALASHERTETSEWAALGSVAGRSVEAGPMPATTAVAAPAAPEPSESTPVPEPRAATSPNVVRKYSTNAEKAPASPTAAPSTDTLTATDVLSTARQALRDQRWSDAAASYEKLVADFPSSPEAHTVLVPLARIEIDRLNSAPSALNHLNAYLTSGGTLAVEAELLRIRAYQSLGRASDEASAIDAFLAAHPSNLEAEKLKTRRATLGAH